MQAAQAERLAETAECAKAEAAIQALEREFQDKGGADDVIKALSVIRDLASFKAAVAAQQQPAPQPQAGGAGGAGAGGAGAGGGGAGGAAANKSGGQETTDWDMKYDDIPEDKRGQLTAGWAEAGIPAEQHKRAWDSMRSAFAKKQRTG